MLIWNDNCCWQKIFRICRRRYLFALISGYFLVAFIIYTQRKELFGRKGSENASVAMDRAFITSTLETSSPRPNCRSHCNIVFMKLHKCASTSMQNIFHRFGYAHNLRFLVPLQGHVFTPLKMPFSAEMVTKLPWHHLGYNISAQHMTWSRKEVHSVMPADSMYVTALRHPVDVYSSAYYFNGRDKKLALQDFVMSEKMLKEKGGGPLGKNSMLFDLGLNASLFTDLNAIQRHVSEIERDFDLVMLIERLDESLVLLKHLLCWKTEDVVAMKLNPSTATGRYLSAEARSRLELALSASFVFYNHFRSIFDQKVERFGRDRMLREVAELRLVRDRISDECQMKRFTKEQDPDSEFRMVVNNVYGYKPLHRSDLCDSLARPESQFTELLRQRQEKLAEPHPSQQTATNNTNQTANDINKTTNTTTPPTKQMPNN